MADATQTEIDVIFESLAIGVDEAMKALGRAPGQDLSPVQEARARVAYQKAWDGTAETGELWAIISGQRDDELNLPDESQKRAAPRSSCKDCDRDITDPAARLKSDPSRCIDHARAKKREQNARYRGS